MRGGETRVDQQEMIPRTPKEAISSLRIYIESEQKTEEENYKKRTEKHIIRMKYFEKQLKNCDLVLTEIGKNNVRCDKDGVVKE